MRNRQNSELKKGYSLIELALYMGLLAVLIVILVELFVSSLRIQIDSQATSSVGQDGRYILYKLSYDLTNAQSIINPAFIGSTSASLNIIASGGSNYLYSVDNGSLTLFTGSGTDNLNSAETAVSNVIFKRLGNGFGKDSIQVNFTLTSNTKRVQGSETKNFQTTILLR